MAVNSVQNNNLGYLKSAVIGGFVGYGTKYLYPITKAEKDDVFVSKMKQISSTKPKDSIKQLEHEKALVAYTKRIRPASVFVLIGVFTAFFIRALKNINKSKELNG